MLIRKKYRVEMGHIVRNCSSDRCAHSMHGHSAVIEVLLYGEKLDNAGMLYDFGLLKGSVKEFIDMFDHCYVFWDKDDPEYIASIKKFCNRWVSLPFNPTAEMLSMMFMDAINNIIRGTKQLNGEDPGLRCCGVIYHETESGFAYCDEDDIVEIWYEDNLTGMKFSPVLTKQIEDSSWRSIWLGRVKEKDKIEPCATPFKQVMVSAIG